jgi:hypothetical protein
MRLTVKTNQAKTPVGIISNPAHDHAAVKFFAQKETKVTIKLIGNIDTTAFLQKQKVSKGYNTLQLYNLAKYPTGIGKWRSGYTKINGD